MIFFYSDFFYVKYAIKLINYESFQLFFLIIFYLGLFILYWLRLYYFGISYISELIPFTLF